VHLQPVEQLLRLCSGTLLSVDKRLQMTQRRCVLHDVPFCVKTNPH